MQKWIFYNWIIIAITALLVGIYISIFENFLDDKAYLYLIIALLSGGMFYFQKKKK
jgi:LPXTG-motif cell wall-anchored protein